MNRKWFFADLRAAAGGAFHARAGRGGRRAAALRRERGRDFRIYRHGLRRGRHAVSGGVRGRLLRRRARRGAGEIRVFRRVRRAGIRRERLALSAQRRRAAGASVDPAPQRRQHGGRAVRDFAVRRGSAGGEDRRCGRCRAGRRQRARRGLAGGLRADPVLRPDGRYRAGAAQPEGRLGRVGVVRRRRNLRLHGVYRGPRAD